MPRGVGPHEGLRGKTSAVPTDVRMSDCTPLAYGSAYTSCKVQGQPDDLRHLFVFNKHFLRLALYFNLRGNVAPFKVLFPRFGP